MQLYDTVIHFLRVYHDPISHLQVDPGSSSSCIHIIFVHLGDLSVEITIFAISHASISDGVQIATDPQHWSLSRTIYAVCICNGSPDSDLGWLCAIPDHDLIWLDIVHIISRRMIKMIWSFSSAINIHKYRQINPWFGMHASNIHESLSQRSLCLIKRYRQNRILDLPVFTEISPDRSHN